MPIGIGLGMGLTFGGKAVPPANSIATNIDLSASSVRSDALASSLVAYIYSNGYPQPTFTEQSDPDNKFTVSGNQLLLSATPGAGPHSVTIRATNGSGTYDEVFSISVTAIDTTPDAFTFTDVTGATLSTVYESNTITIAGVSSPATVSITGGEYSKNGGAYTSSGGTASNGDTFKVRHTSSGSNSTATNTVLTIGGVSDTYTTTTAAAVDTTPDAFSFTDVTGATISTLYESNTITVAGVTSPATVTVTGGEYSKNGGGYTSSAGTASNGDTFKVRHTSSGSYTTATNTVLTIGGVSDTYTTTTAADLDAPVLTWVSDETELANPEFHAVFVAEIGDVLTIEIDNNSDFSSLFDSDANTLDSGEVTAQECTFSGISALAAGTTYYARLKLARGGDEIYSNTVSQAMASASGPTFDNTPEYGTATFSNADRTVTTTAINTIIKAGAAIVGKKAFAVTTDDVVDYSSIGVFSPTGSPTLGLGGNSAIGLAWFSNGTSSGSYANPGSMTDAGTVGIVVDEPNGRMWITYDGSTFYGSASTNLAGVVAATTPADIYALSNAAQDLYAAVGSAFGGTGGQVFTILTSWPWTLPTGYTYIDP